MGLKTTKKQLNTKKTQIGKTRRIKVEEGNIKYKGLWDEEKVGKGVV